MKFQLCDQANETNKQKTITVQMKLRLFDPSRGRCHPAAGSVGHSRTSVTWQSSATARVIPAPRTCSR